MFKKTDLLTSRKEWAQLAGMVDEHPKPTINFKSWQHRHRPKLSTHAAPVQCKHAVCMVKQIFVPIFSHNLPPNKSIQQSIVVHLAQLLRQGWSGQRLCANISQTNPESFPKTDRLCDAHRRNLFARMQSLKQPCGFGRTRIDDLLWKTNIR